MHPTLWRKRRRKYGDISGGGDSEQGGRHGHVVGLLKLKSRVPQGLTQFSALVRRYSRVRTNPSDNYIDSLQILKTPTYLNVQKKTVLYIFYFRDTSLNVGDA